jgi:hypothetical protein
MSYIVTSVGWGTRSVIFSKSSETTAKRIARALHAAAAALHCQEASHDLLPFLETFDNFGTDAIRNSSLNFNRLQFGALAFR